ncbi:MAG: S-layer homology domain-containing protein [Oscillospiraceae bacterium]|nr:S-layer homology domain-containing protein [Oscillospiraceae bacterium]
MKSFKKVLALVMVFALSLSLFAGAVEFTDANDIHENYQDDVNMLVELGVLGGYPDGSFRPEDKITRAEFAKMAYVLKYGADDNGNLFAGQTSSFTDVENNGNVKWAKGYINYCENQGIVSGVGNNKFNPNGNVTVAEASKMLLVILGCNADKEGFKGTNWASNTVAKAMELGLFEGWSGDPTAPASRQLVAKLMRNAIFAPVYVYSPITGIGSQYNALDGSKNQTLGEQVMGLKHVTGIVVANENYAITKDADGETIKVDNGPAIAVTNKDSEESIIYYEAQNTTGTYLGSTIKIDREVSDELLGAKVDVYFKADHNSSSLAYTNVEVIGDVIVSSDTKIYNVPAGNVEMMPNGESTSSALITPYISFTVDGTEYQVKANASAKKVAKNVDYNSLWSKDQANDFTNFAYASTATYKDGGTLFQPTGDHSFFQDMGEGSVANYRFVSVDGGKTFSYIFKIQTSADSIQFGQVSSVSESKKTITLPKLGAVDFDDVVMYDGIAKDDYVIYYFANGKINIEKVETMTGALEAFGDDGSVTINGTKYYGDENLCQQMLTYGSLSDFYTNNKQAMKAGTVYRVYGNTILDIEFSNEVSSAENYAVILNSSYDSQLDVAYVKLGFADNTEGTYKVGKFYTKYAATPNHAENDRAQDYANNARFGWVVEYSMREDGTVDLSHQDFKGLEKGASLRVPNSSKTYKIVEKSVSIDGKRYYGDSSSILFVLYGDLEGDYTSQNYKPVKSRAYKLSNVTDATAKPISGLKINNASQNAALGSAVVDTNGYSNSVVAAAITHGDNLGNISYKSSDSLAYVVSAKQMYNVSTGSAYASLKLITEDGLLETTSIDDVTDLNNNVIFSEAAGYVGNIKNYESGTVVRYSLNAEGKVEAISSAGGLASDMNKDPSNAQNGLFYVNAAQIVDDRFVYYNSQKAHTLGSDGRLDADGADSLLLSEDGYKIITINDDEYAGSYLVTVARNQELKKGDFNAIIELEEGEIIRIFSFEQ